MPIMRTIRPPGELFWAPEHVLDLVAIFIYIHASGSFYVNIR